MPLPGQTLANLNLFTRGPSVYTRFCLWTNWRIQVRQTKRRKAMLSHSPKFATQTFRYYLTSFRWFDRRVPIIGNWLIDWLIYICPLPGIYCLAKVMYVEFQAKIKRIASCRRRKNKKEQMKEKMMIAVKSIDRQPCRIEKHPCTILPRCYILSFLHPSYSNSFPATGCDSPLIWFIIWFIH